MGKAEQMSRKGWFVTDNRDGDRTLDQQLIGLNTLLAEAPGKTVIDAGCAEGLISMELARRGAKSCTGFEIVASHVAIARALSGAQMLPCQFVQANLNQFNLSAVPKADIVLALAILHKVKDPSALCAALADLCNDLCVIRLPPYGQVIVDARSENVPHDIGAVMESKGFTLESVEVGPLSEWLGYFRRKVVAVEPLEPAPAEPEAVPVPEPEVPVEVVAEAPREPAPEPVLEMLAEFVASPEPSAETAPRRIRKAKGE